MYRGGHSGTCNSDWMQQRQEGTHVDATKTGGHSCRCNKDSARCKQDCDTCKTAVTHLQDGEAPQEMQESTDISSDIRTDIDARRAGPNVLHCVACRG